MDTPANPSIDTPCTASFLMLSSHSTVFICLIFSCLCTGVANQHLDFGGVILGQHHGPLQISDDPKGYTVEDYRYCFEDPNDKILGACPGHS